MTLGQGYPDYQRVVNWDSPPLIEEVVKKLPFEVPLLNMSRYANLCLRVEVQESDGPIAVCVEWYQLNKVVPETYTFIAQSTWCMPGSAEGPGLHTINVTLPARAPYARVKIEASSVKTTKLTGAIWVSANNRSVSQICGVSSSFLIQLENAKRLKGEKLTVYPAFFYTGPMTVSLRAVAPPGSTWALEVMQPNVGEWKLLWLQDAPDSFWHSYQLYAPLGYWRFQANNESAGEATFGVAATCATSGS